MNHSVYDVASYTHSFLSAFQGSAYTDLNSRYQEYLSRIGFPYPPTQAVPFFAPQRWRNICRRLSRELFARLEESSRLLATSSRGLTEWPIPKHLSGVVHQKFHWQSNHPVMRTDVFFDPMTDDVSILEVNAADPSAFAWNDMMLESLYRQENFATYSVEHRLTADRMTERHLNLVLQRYYDQCRAYEKTPKRNPSIALSIAKDSTVHFDFAALECIYRSFGAEVCLVSPSEFRWDRDNDVVFAREKPVDIIVRDTLDEVFFPEGGCANGDLASILCESDICVVNPVASTLGDQKSWLAILWRSLLIDGGSPSAAELQRALPETHLLTLQNRDSFSKNKNLWVLKPSSGYGGHGVVIGSTCPQQDWDAHLRTVMDAQIPHVMQRYRQPGLAFITRDANEWKSTEDIASRNAVFSFWAFEGEFVGAFVRLSNDPIINTHNGGGLVPVLWVP